MYTSKIPGKQQNRINQYLLKEIMEATPQQLLIKLYDIAIMNCQKKDLAKTTAAIQVLISALKYDNEEVAGISVGLFRLYQYCQEEMRQQNYDMVYKILTDLRETWISKFGM